MRKTLFALLIGIMSCSAALSQSSSVKGIISDTSSKTSLQNAVVSLLQPKDSVLVKFTRTLAGGGFEISNVPAGKYLLVVSYPKYADYADEITVEAGLPFNAGTIPVILKAKLLEEVVVRQKIAAIRFKGDTLEFKADSFRVNPNANAQELLKKLPGLQVNSKGEITAQGEKVEKVLVDGEEFFSDDPAVVTHRLRADGVDKVLLFHKKSDQAAFTGIDD
ncbi:MAG: carboxypeptidase regulatory-like domain-containing protein, partial [Flavihumibacter sp.]|nr:carboxypeptidase regulatory-like domain-containing protein [Flavihumibacter sp.]